MDGRGGRGPGRTQAVQALAGHGRVRDHATPHGVDRGPGRHGQGGARLGRGDGGRGGDLVEQVDELLDRADEVAGGQIGGSSRTASSGARGPAVAAQAKPRSGSRRNDSSLSCSSRRARSRS